MDNVVEGKGTFAEIEKQTALSEEDRKKQADIKKAHSLLLAEIMGDVQKNRGSFLDNLIGKNQGTKEAPLKFFLTRVISELSSIFPHERGDGSPNEKAFRANRKKILDIFDEVEVKTEEYAKGWGFIPLVREETIRFKFTGKDQEKKGDVNQDEYSEEA